MLCFTDSSCPVTCFLLSSARMAVHCTVAGKIVPKQRARVLMGPPLWMSLLLGFVVSHICHLKSKHICWTACCSAYGCHEQNSPIQDPPLQLDMEIYFLKGSLRPWWYSSVVEHWASMWSTLDSISSPERRGPFLESSSLLWGFIMFIQAPSSSVIFPGNVIGKTPHCHLCSLPVLSFVRQASIVRELLKDGCVWSECLPWSSHWLSCQG